MVRRIHYTTTDGGPQTAVSYWSLQEEVMADFGQEFRQLALDAFDVAPSTITDIDEFRAHFKPERAFAEAMKRMGYTNATLAAVPQAVKDAFKVYSRVALMALLFDHGRLPGGSSPIDWGTREAIP